MATRSVAKDFHRLLKNVASFSDKQAAVVDHDFNTDENGEDFTLTVRITPNDGLYRGGTFDFKMFLDEYPEKAPSVTCLTKIYHPNIDYSSDEDNICLSLLDSEWSESCTLEDVVQGILFLIYNPNLDDALSTMFEGSTPYNVFEENVTKSLRGEDIDGEEFEENLSTEKIVEEIIFDILSDVVLGCNFSEHKILAPEIINQFDITESEGKREVFPDQGQVTLHGEILTSDVLQELDPIYQNDLRCLDNTLTLLNSTEKKPPLLTPNSDKIIENPCRCSQPNFHTYPDHLIPEIPVLSALIPKLAERLFCCIRRKPKDPV